MLQNDYPAEKINSRPNISEIVAGYTQLRNPAMKQLGLCPIHGERTPSFRVNEAKGNSTVWLRRQGGDVIRFIELVEGVDFKGAIRFLGMGDDPPPPRKSVKRRGKSGQWINEQIEKMNAPDPRAR